VGKGSNTTSSSTTSSADPQAAQLYRDILTRAQGVASTPYQAYSGELTAPINSQQQAGIGNINTNAGFASPYIQQASGLATASSTPITGSTIQQYMNPYTQQVIDATEAQMQHDNASAMANLQGNQIAQGALGGNATGVAKGILAGQQNRTNASTISGLYSQNYQQALQAAQQQQQTGLAGANALANYGISGQNAALAGANAQVGAGNLLQQTQQQQDTANYGQYTQAQAYPYQQLSWLAGLGTGVGSNLGGTSTGSTTGPAPNSTGQWLGAGLSLAGMFLNRGGRVHRAGGGGVGNIPWSGGEGWIPTLNIHGGSGAPHSGAPGLSSTQSSFDPSKMASGITSLGAKAKGLDWGGAWNAGLGDLSGADWGGGSFLKGDAYGGSSASPLPGLSAADYGAFAAGGGVSLAGAHRGYADGGAPLGYAPADDSVDPDVMDWLGHRPVHVPQMVEAGPSRVGSDEGERRFPGMSFEDRAAPAVGAIARGDFDPQGANSTTFEGTPGMQMANAGLVPSPRPRPEGAGVAPDEDDDGDQTPSSGLVVAGRGQQAPVMAFAPEGQPGGYRQMPDAITHPGGDDSGFGLGLLSRNAKTGLLSAGLGMLASRSPFLGNVVGEGGLAGVHAYGAAEEADRKAALEAEKLRREAENTSFSHQLETRRQTETERHNLASEDDTPKGYERTADGMRAIPGGPADPDQIAKISNAKAKLAPGSNIDPDTADFLADRLRVGDNKALTGLGHGLQGSNNILEVQRRAAARSAAGIPIMDSARDMQSNTAANAGLIAAERTQAQIMSRLSVYGRSAYNAADLALEASKEFPRTQFPKVNAALAAYKSNTGDPGIKAFGQAVTTLANEYARAVGGGHGTVHQQEQAERRLSETQSPEQFAATVAMMKREIVQAEHALPAARQQIREIYAPTSKGASTSIEGRTEPAATAQGFNVPEAAKRTKGQIYNTPKGELRWNGQGWEQP
jgi:hypothetical protein